MNEDRSQALHRAALLAWDEERLEDAAVLLRSAVREDTSNASAWNDLGVMMETLGNPSQAVRCYVSSIRADATKTEALANLASLGAQIELRRKMREIVAQAWTSSIAASSGSRLARASSF